MRWFKKRPTPFDDNFSMRTEVPPDSPYYRYMHFTIPDWYYAHLVFIGFYYDAYVAPDPFDRGFKIRTTRGDQISAEWMLTVFKVVNRSYIFRIWHNAIYKIHPLSLPNLIEEPMPNYLFLYPGDIVTVHETPVHTQDRMKDFILTFRIWEV